MATAPSPTYAAASGQTINAGRFPGGRVRGGFTLDNWTLAGALASAGGPPPPAPTGNITQFLTSDGGSASYSGNFSGPTRDYWHRRLGFAWKRTNTLGNWLDASQVEEGGSAFGTSAAITAVDQVLVITANALVSRWMSTGQNRGAYLRVNSGSAFPVAFYGRADATDANRPKLTVITNTGTFVLTAAANAYWYNSSFTGNGSAAEWRLSSGAAVAVLRFDLSTVTGSFVGATLSVKVKSFPSGGSTGQVVGLYECDPPTIIVPENPASPVLGLADGYADFNTWKASGDPALIAADDFELGGPFDGGFDPAAPRILNPETNTTYARGEITTGANGSANSRLEVSSGTGVQGIPNIVREEVFGQYWLYLESDFGTTQDDAIKIPAMGVQFGYWVPTGGSTGYWQQTTGNGGAIGTGLKVDRGGGLNYEYQGHSVRFLTGTLPTLLDDDPYAGWFGMSIYDYNLDQVGPFPAGASFPMVAIRPLKQYCIDIRVKQNTMTGAQDGLGNYATANPDGVYEVWINGVAAYSRTNYRWRKHAEFGVQGMWIDVYHGGTSTQSAPGSHYQLDRVSLATSYIGPKVEAAPAVGVEPVPVFQRAKSYDNASAFTTTLTSTDAGEQFDVGTGPSTGIVVRVVASTHAATIDSFVIGGVTLTALAQTALSGWSANERVFYGVGLSLTGLQSWAATVSAGARINVQILAARSAVTFTAGPVVSVLNNTFSQAITQDANTLTVGMLTSNHDSGTLSVKGGTYQKWTRASNFYKDVIVTEPPSDTSIDAVITGGAFTFSWLGRVCYLQGSVAAAPSWVPAAGEMATLTVANGKLANNYRSQCAPNFGEFWFVKTANTYGGVTKNPYWGTYGCAQFFSGGHANTNDNTVTIAEYGATQVTFRRAVDPTPWFGTGTDATTQGNNSAGSPTNQLMDVISAGPPVVFDYGISTIDGKPGSSHTYGSGDCIGPDNGFAACGTHFRVSTPALNQQNQYGAISMLAVDYASTTEPSSARSWYKYSLNRRNESGFGSAPVLTQFVGPQKRVYIVTNGNATIRWADLATGTYVDGSGTGFGYDNADGFDGGTMFYVPSRGLLICAYRQAGNVTIQWMDVTVAQPTLGGTATLSLTLPVADPWGGATWCPDNNRVIVGSVTGNHDAMYEIEIPASLGGTWTVTRAALGAGQTWPVMNSSGEFKRFHYDERIKAIFYFQYASSVSADTAYAYKPRNT